MKGLKNIFSKVKYVLATSIVAILAVQAILPALTIKASETPRFNFMANDPKTLRGVNRSQDQTQWANSVSGKVGEEFRGLVYVHNGILPSEAKNTKVKVTIPSQTTDGKLVVTAQISADNAETKTDTMTFNLDGDANVQFIPGTGAWFPDVNNNAQTQRSFPNGQTGDEIANQGVNIGDETNFFNRNDSNYPNIVVNPNNTSVHGCWNYISYVSFGFRTIPQNVANIEIDKTVRNVTTGESSFVDANQAKAADTLEYKLLVKNSGKATADSVLVTDTIPANTSYIKGTTRVSLNGGAEYTAQDTLTGNGLAFADLKAGETILIKFRVKIADGIAINQNLINTGYASFSKITVSDTAKTTIVKTPVPVEPGVGPELPVSGAATYLVSIASMLGVAYGFYLIKRRKALASEENVIATQLLAQ